MANARSSNVWFVDTSSSSGTATSFLSERNLKLIGILYWVNTAASDEIAIYDKDPNTSAAGPQKLSLKCDVAKKSVDHPTLKDSPIIFPNGVWVTLTGTPKATLVFTTAVGN